MSQQEHSEENLLPIPEPMIQQQVENSTLGGGMQAAIGKNIQIQNSNNVTVNNTEILQISVVEIKTRKFIETSPYKGLKKFEPEDKDLFFGRDQFLQGLVDELEQTNLVLLLGASGSGKSSVVRAGLVPWLFRKYGTRLVNLIFTPDQDPFESLYASLLSKNTQASAQIAREAKADILIQVVTRLKQADDYWFILIDQFEELFTTSQSEKRDRFIASLVQLAKAKLLRVKIMATMRADFLDKLSPYPALVNATDKHRPMIAEMQPDELRLAIEQPAAHHGVVFETGLVEEIIKDIQGQAGYLPLLQYTLNLLWETEVKTGNINDRTLNISTYRQLGGVRGALQQRVDKIYEDLSAQEKIATQRIFLKLVDIGGDENSDTEGQPVRRRALRSEFSDKLEQGVLVKLINNNLLVSDRPLQSQQSTVEIAHETLLTSWTTLNTWIKENRNSIALRNRLNDDVERWEASKAEDELWTGSKLEKVQELREDATFNQVLGGFSQTANQFIDASLGLRDRQLRRARRTAIVGVTLAMLASAGGMLAFFLWQESQKQNIIALTQNAEVRLRSNQQLDAMIEAIRVGKQFNKLLVGKDDVSTQVLGSLQQVIHGTQERLRLTGNRVVFSSDGKQLVIGGGDGTVRFWDTASGKLLNKLNRSSDRVTEIFFSSNAKQIATAAADGTVWLWDGIDKPLPLRGHSGRVLKVVFSPNNKRVITLGTDTTYRLWDASSGKQLAELPKKSNSINSVVFSPDSKWLAIGGDDGMVRLCDTVSCKQLIQWRGHSGSVHEVMFSPPNGQLLATVGEDRKVKLWETSSGKNLVDLGRNSAYLTRVAFSPDGKQLASVGGEGKVWLCNTSACKQLRELRRLRGSVYSIYELAFSPDGKQIATGEQDGVVRLWDTISHSELAELGRHSGSVADVVFSPTGKQIATIGQDGTVRLWETSYKQLASWRGDSEDVFEVVFSSDGKQLATIGRGRKVRLWNTSGQQLDELGGYSGLLYGVAFSPNGIRLATLGQNGKALLWDRNGKLLAQLDGHSGIIWSVVFNPDGKQLATLGQDGKAILWDINGKQLVKLGGHSGIVRKMAFSPDNKRLATLGQDEKAILWDSNSRQLAQLPRNSSSIWSMVFSPDGKQLATGEADGTVNLWNGNGKELIKLRGHSGLVNSVAFSPDGKQLATGGQDGYISLWEASSGNHLAGWRGHSWVNSVIFSPDGKQLASGGKDGMVRLWQVGDLEDMLTRSCNWVRSYLNSKPEDDPDRHLCDRTRNDK